MSAFFPRSNFIPPDLQRSYRIIRATAAGTAREQYGPYAGLRSALQGRAGYGDIGISKDAEERVNLPPDSNVATGDIIECVEDGQKWSVVFVRRQPDFRVVYLSRQSMQGAGARAL